MDNVNEAEADKVIEVLKSILKDYEIEKLPSIGIATFNIKQKSLIQDKIAELRNNNDDIGKKLNSFDNTTFFVKNLDSIQGDERDIIIVSTTFGKTPDGRFIQNFGPINSYENGHRFLNVMITRAKKKLIVVSGIPAYYYQKYEEELSNSDGPRGKAGLYTWLAYVKSVSDGNLDLRLKILNTLKLYGYVGNTTTAEYNLQLEAPFENIVIESVKDLLDGCKVETQRFEAGFLIDIAIRTPSGQKIAIECDGTSHHDSPEAYSWDMFREKQIPQKCGYTFYRIWSKNWWADTENEINKLREFLLSHGCL